MSVVAWLVFFTTNSAKILKVRLYKGKFKAKYLLVCFIEYFFGRFGFMARKLIPAVFLTILLALCTGPVFAESVVVEDDVIFIADDGLSVLNVDDGLTADCSADLDTVSGATDVVISDDGTAVVTVGAAGSISVKLVDVSDCLDGTSSVNVSECVATIDLDNGVIDIPCVYYGSVVYEIEMKQRGNSSNWEISFADANGDMLDYRHDGNSNDNDDNSNDNDDNSNDNDDGIVNDNSLQ